MDVHGRAGATAPAARLDASSPDRCYLCGGDGLELRFPGHLPDGPRPSTAFNCTSFGHRRHHPIWRCSLCGLLVQWPHPAAEELLAAYTDVEDPTYVDERRNRYLTFERVLHRLGPAQGRRLLDVGAYCGYFVDVAAKAGFAAEGLELSSWAVAQAEAIGATVHRETLADHARHSEPYNAITMWDVVEHLHDPRAELAHVHRLLAPGGRLYLSTIDSGSRLARFLGRRWPWLMEMHLFYFDRPSITLLLEQAGFDVVSITHYTHVISARYLLEKAAASYPVTARPLRRLRSTVPEAWRVPFNLGDNMLIAAEKRA